MNNIFVFLFFFSNHRYLNINLDIEKQAPRVVWNNTFYEFPDKLVGTTENQFCNIKLDKPIEI